MKHHMLCAMGVADAFVVHTIETPFAVTEGDAQLLCSDGWWEPMQALDIERTLGQSQNSEQWLQPMHSLIALAGNPCQDNHSAIAVWIGGP